MSTVVPVESYLCVGIPVFLDVQSDRGNTKRAKSKLRGWVPREYILLDLPGSHEEAAFILKDAPCVLRFVHQGEACGFDSKIMDWCDMGLPFFRIQWPSSVQTLHVRKHARVPVQLACKVGWTDGEEDGEINDLSVSGCGVLANRLFKVGSGIRLTFTLPDGSPLRNVRATVCRSRPQGSQVVLGCQFLEDTRGDRDPLVFFISTTLSRMGVEPLSGRRVLVLHDEETNLKPLVSAFERAGVQVITAKGAVDGFYRLRMAPPGCLLIDVNQPLISVTDVCGAILQTPGFENTPLFLLGDTEDGEGLRKRCRAKEWFPQERVQQDADAVAAACIAQIAGF